MKQITRSALLPYSARAMFDLVNDVARYPEFLPWCHDAQVLSMTETSMQARIGIKKAGMTTAFTTDNRLEAPSRIDLALVEGPFQHLHGTWHFDALGDAQQQACRITLDLRFQMKHQLLSLAVGPVFEQIAQTMVQSFSERAKQLYG